MQPDEPGALALLEDLDRPGPALPIGDAQARAMIAGAFAAPPVVRAPRRVVRYAIAATLCAAIAGTAAAALWRASHRAAPEELPAPPRPVVVPQKEVPAPAEPAPPPPAPAPVVVPRRTGSAHDLLRLANESRAKQKWRDAQSLYRRVEREYAGNATAYIAMMADASLRIEHLHDARGALRLYKAALADGPPALREEAAFGVAESYRALHDRRGETRALESFVADHPDSPMAPRARERLRELGH